jgi:CRP-like cAMP-binding protein
VPNSVLIKNPVMLEGKRPGDGFIRERRRLDFHVDRNLLPTDVLAAVRAGFEHDVPRGASEEPAPSVLLMRFGESYNEYQVRYWLSDLAIDDVVDSEVRSRIAYALHRAGIPLAVPAQAITFTSGEDSARRAESGGLAERLAALEALPIFKALGPDEIAALAPRLSRAPYLAGETVVLQGDDVDHLYLLVKGRAEVRVAAPGVGELPIATITGPDLFGEMGVLTGDARRATVVALTELLCFTLSRSMFQEIMKKRPAIAEDFSRILAERERHLLSVLEGASDSRDLEDSQVRLLTRIRRFFGIDEDGGPPDRRDSKAG